MTVYFGYRFGVVRSSRVSMRIPVRATGVAAVLLACAAITATLSLVLGDYELTIPQVVAALAGGADPFTRMIVLDWRAPMAVSALVFGALLGIGGAIFQSLTRNPLGSPDIIGFDAGSYTAVVLSIVVFGGGGFWSSAAASLLGGLTVAVAVYLLAYRRGLLGFRLIVVGVAVSALLCSINAYLVSRADLDDALTVGFWAAGSLGRMSWSTLLPSTAVAAAVVVGAALLAPSLRRLEGGDDLAVAQGSRPGRVRLILVLVGVSTTALVTAAAGPIGFVALAAPQLARRLTRSSDAGLLGAAAMGAALLASAHLLSLVIAAVFRPVPVGLVTVCIGGMYLIGLLLHETRRPSRGVL